MKDILDRELKDGDLCIGMAIGRNSSGMHIGVFKGSSVVYLSYSEKFLNKSCTSNTYLIENPTEKELEIKSKIQSLLDEEENERKRKAEMKTIPLSKLEIGGIYETTQGTHFVYLGKRKVTFESLDGRWKDEKEGNCFAFVYFSDNSDERFDSDDYIKERITYINPYATTYNIDVLKGNKKLTKFIRKIDLGFPLVNEVERRGDKYRLTIE